MPAGVDAAEIQSARGKNGLHLVSLVLAEQAVVDKNAGKLTADGLAQKRGQHRGIHTAGERQQHPA